MLLHSERLTHVILIIIVDSLINWKMMGRNDEVNKRGRDRAFSLPDTCPVAKNNRRGQVSVAEWLARLTAV